MPKYIVTVEIDTDKDTDAGNEGPMQLSPVDANGFIENLIHAGAAHYESCGSMIAQQARRMVRVLPCPQTGIPERVLEESGSARRSRTIEDLIRDCWEIQNASNPVAVALAVHEAMVDLRRIYPNAPMQLIQYHPIVFMFYYKLADMLGDVSIYNEIKAKLQYLADLHGVELKN